MTARDFRLIAEAVKQAYQSVGAMDMGLPRVGVTAVAAELAAALRKTNARFDTARFLAACGVPDNQ